MIDQLIIGDKASYADFGASVASRTIGLPAKKVIKETVPFSNKTYDFSGINGEVYWEERELEYVFEILADHPQMLEDQKQAFADWVMNVVEEQIFDPFIPDYHFIGTFAEMDFEDDETLIKTTATVTFAAYPYKVSNHPSVSVYSIAAGATAAVLAQNQSSHRILPVLEVDGSVRIEYNGVTFTASAGTYSSETFMLEPGANVLSVTNESDAECTLKISFTEEVF
jgi:hypothetical protein